jgi:Fe-S cluster assembly protein SufD
VSEATVGTAATAPSDFAGGLGAALARPQPKSVRELRERAFRSFEERGLPRPKEEEWRFTNVAPVARGRFEPVDRAAFDAALVGRELAAARLAGSHEIVFVDGRYAPALSSPGEVPGVRIRNLADASPEDWERIGSELGRRADVVQRPFAALSTALFADGAAVEIAPGAVVATPVHLVFWSTAAARPTAVFPRVLVTVGENAQATVIESYRGAPGAGYLVCPVTELVAGPGSVVDHYKLQRDSPGAYHLALFHLEAERSATISTQSFSFGSAIARHDVHAVLGGEGAEVTLNGLYLVRDRQLADFHMRVDHASPHTTSHELFKGVLDDHARGVFNGHIHVHPQAQKTDAKQTSRNLILSPDALVNANPQLEIYADDVKCTHGSTVGQLDEEAVFYLRSRGIGVEAARSLLTYAFAADLVERTRVEPLREALQEFLLAWIPQGEVVREAV